MRKLKTKKKQGILRLPMDQRIPDLSNVISNIACPLCKSLIVLDVESIIQHINKQLDIIHPFEPDDQYRIANFQVFKSKCDKVGRIILKFKLPKPAKVKGKTSKLSFARAGKIILKAL